MQLSGKKILLGITGSIAAYKTPDLVRLFIKEGAEVRVVATPDALHFVTALSLSTVSRNPVYSEFVRKDGLWNNHVELGAWADYFLVAPATANTVAKMASGLCDNLLAAVYLSARCPVGVAPAMDLDMYAHAATRQNLALLLKRKVQVIGPASGDLASGLTGEGRMEEPEVIFAHVLQHFMGVKDFAGTRVLVTAGPTREPIDAVRYISNHSSGKMGYALAGEFGRRGAEVVLITGPVNLAVRETNIRLVAVNTAQEMYRACMKEFPGCRVCVMSAAVADYTPKHTVRGKIKKESSAPEALDLKPTPDILAALGEMKQKGQLLAGFALETDNEVAHARKKLKNKNLDFIVLNSLRDPGAGFNSDTNKITILEKGKKPRKYPLKSKIQVAKDIVDLVRKLI